MGRRYRNSEGKLEYERMQFTKSDANTDANTHADTNADAYTDTHTYTHAYPDAGSVSG